MRIHLYYKGYFVKRREKGILNPLLFTVIFIIIILTVSSCDQTSPVQLSYGKVSKTFDTNRRYNTETSLEITGESRALADVMGRILTIPIKVDRVICSGSGCLRMLTYLDAHDRIVAVDGIEVRGFVLDARPYAIANEQFKKFPIFGEFRGYDNPELIAGLDPKPQVILKIRSGGGSDPEILQDKTGIPVFTLDYGNLTYDRETFYRNLRLMAEVVNAKQRAEEVILYIEGLIEDLKARTPVHSKKTCYVGGIAQSGPHGIQSTDPFYAPFEFLGLTNVAGSGLENTSVSYMNVAKEQIIVWDPDFIFLDISTLRLGSDINALEQLRRDPSLQELKALKSKQIYGLFPNYSYNLNLEVVLANAYYIGKILYPEEFHDIDPFKKAEEISVFLNGGPAFASLNRMFDNAGFTKISL